MDKIKRAAVITGASRGIGRAIATKFAKEGISLVLNFKTAMPQDLVDELNALNAEYELCQGDVSDYAFAKDMAKTAKARFGRIDYLINNAGITKDGLVLNMKEEAFDSVVDTNLKGAFNTIAHISPIMTKQREGAIINISSVAGVFGNAGQANYSAAKAGLIGLTKAVSRELGSRSITANVIAPGPIETDMTQGLTDSIRESLVSRTSLGRLGQPEEVAELCYFLVNAKFITGQVIVIDGGM